MKKFVIIDLSKDLDLTINDSLVFHLSHGTTKLNNSQILKKNLFSENKFQKFRNLLNNLLLNFYNKTKDDKSKIHLSMIEFFNSRNDKNQIYNKLFYLIEILNFLKKKKIKNLEIITDDSFFYNTYKSIKFNKVNVILTNKKQKKNGLLYYFLSTTFFFMKTMVYIFFVRLFKKEIQKIAKESCLSIYPIFFKNKKNLFYKKNYLNLNFQITDETHLNNSLFQNLKSIWKIKNLKNTIMVEKYITALDLIKCYRNSLRKYKSIKNAKDYNFIYSGLCVKDQFYYLFYKSFLNNNKINIYDQALKKIVNKYKIKSFHYYLFEYSFGFYVNNFFKKNFPKVELIGYQHGIYSERIMWQDFSKKIKNKSFFPDKIVCKYFQSLKIYKKNFKNVKILFKKSKNIYKNITNFRTNKYNVFLGLHDCYNSINGLRNLEDKKEFILNFHPKLRYDKKIKLSNNMKINFENKKYKNTLKILSSTSTIPYQLFLKEKFFIFVPKNIIPLNPKVFDKFFFKN